MKKIVVGSTNAVKLDAARIGFQQMFPDEQFVVEGIEVDSGVGAQPMGEGATLHGAHNRLLAAKKARPDADFWVGQEGGLDKMGVDMLCFAWIMIEDRNRRSGQAQTAAFFLPPGLADLVRQGYELGEASAILLPNTDRKKGGLPYLTGGNLDRVQHYVRAVVLALIPFKHPDLYRR